MSAIYKAKATAKTAHEDELYASNPGLYRPYMDATRLKFFGEEFLSVAEMTPIMKYIYAPSNMSHRMESGYMAEAIEAKFPGTLQKISALYDASFGTKSCFFLRKIESCGVQKMNQDTPSDNNFHTNDSHKSVQDWFAKPIHASLRTAYTPTSHPLRFPMPIAMIMSEASMIYSSYSAFLSHTSIGSSPHMLGSESVMIGTKKGTSPIVKEQSEEKPIDLLKEID